MAEGSLFFIRAVELVRAAFGENGTFHGSVPARRDRRALLSLSQAPQLRARRPGGHFGPRREVSAVVPRHSTRQDHHDNSGDDSRRLPSVGDGGLERAIAVAEEHRYGTTVGQHVVDEEIRPAVAVDVCHGHPGRPDAQAVQAEQGRRTGQASEAGHGRRANGRCRQAGSP